MSGGSQTTTNQLPAWYEAAAQKQLSVADRVSKKGFVPNMGPSVAAFAPQQVDSMQSASDWATAFGLHPKRDVAASLPTATDYGGGVKGYSSYPLYTKQLDMLKTTYPGLYSYITQMMIDPVTGVMNGGQSDTPNGSFYSSNQNNDVYKSYRNNR